MKRKIAILLSAMMVTSAMPITASAAQLKSDSVLNTTFAKANETIDANSSNYKNYETVDELKGRKSVIKINLNDDNTNSITGTTSFKVQLENGTFDENKLADYQYYNSNGTTQVTYDQAMSGVTSSNGLKKVYENVAASQSAPTIELQNTTEIKMSDINDSSPQAYKDIKAAFEEINQTDNSGFSAINSDDLLYKKFPSLEKAVNELVNTIVAEQTVGVPNLAHIPYQLKIDSPTTATVTVPDLGLSDSDKKITMTNTKVVDTSKIKIELCESGSTKINPTDYTQLGTSGSKVITGFKFTADITSAVASPVSGKEPVVENPYIALPLGAVVADGSAPVKAKITSDYNDKVVGGEYTITTSVQEGNTSVVYDKNNVKSFEDYAQLSPVVIKENVRGTIGTTATNGNEVTLTLRVNGGFRFKTGGSNSSSNVKFYNDKTNATLSTRGNVEFSANDSVMKVTLTGLGANRTLPTGIRIEGLFVEGINDKNLGDVELSVSGDGITSQSMVVAKKEKLGFKLETLKDPKEIISGRHYKNNDVSMSEADNTTVEIKFSEAVPNTLVESRALDFNVPEGVKIVGMELTKTNNFDSSNMLEQADFEIINNGKTLRLKRDSYKVKSSAATTNVLANFTMKLDLSVDPSFKGDIKLGVTGGGQSDTVETVIAKAVIPFEIKSQSTKLNIGYQDYNTADIVITEAKPGMFLENKTAVLSLAAPYGTQELGFSEAKFEVSGGELEVKEKDFKVGENNGEKGTINFKINKASYKNPSTITIKNVKVGTTRSVPFGAYDLKLKGDAVINNYKSDVKDDKSFDVTSKDVNLVNQNNTSSYDFKNYVEVITETGTLDKTVKVSVGEKTVLVGDQAIDMDVAPYIQASSNSTMVPLRFVSVALGVDTGNVANPDASNKIAWDANTKTTTIYYGAGTGQKIIQFQAGSNIMTVDGTRIPMEYGVKAEIKDGRMFVPFRALGQALGVAVTWDADSRTAIYNENNARNSNTTTTASTTTESTTASTTKESTTESTTASDKTTETTTKKTN
nr:copper amine oxidase N-terminal domain-containing protein [uncultured Tyzzerella sp.]